jgi:uncharacterized protein
MNIDGEIFIDAPRASVWLALNDPQILARCIEGCEALEKVNDQQFSGRVTAKVGPVKATFSGLVTISDVVPEVSYTISGEGKGGVAGFAKGGADVRLEDAENGGTRLFYTAKANVGGKLAQLGSRLIESTARAQADKFFASLAAVLAPNIPAAAAETALAAAATEGRGVPAWLWVGLLVIAGAALLYIQLA